jgi:hypothetical protein
MPDHIVDAITSAAVIMPDTRHSLSNQGKHMTSKAKKKKQAKGSSYADRKGHQIATKKSKSQLKSKLSRG